MSSSTSEFFFHFVSEIFSSHHFPTILSIFPYFPYIFPIEISYAIVSGILPWFGRVSSPLGWTKAQRKRSSNPKAPSSWRQKCRSSNIIGDVSVCKFVMNFLEKINLETSRGERERESRSCISESRWTPQRCCDSLSLWDITFWQIFYYVVMCFCMFWIVFRKKQTAHFGWDTSSGAPSLPCCFPRTDQPLRAGSLEAVRTLIVVSGSTSTW